MADPVLLFNRCEVVLWLVAAGICSFRAVKLKSSRRRMLLATVTFVAFAGTDVAEQSTGAWWRPWWLLLWNAACVLSLLGLAWSFWRTAASQRAAAADAANTP